MTNSEKNKLLQWEFILRNISDYVKVDSEKGLKFIVRSDEMSGHHRPHLHVESSSASMSIAIDNAEILACSGKISPAQKRRAVEWMKENKELAEKYWNEFSNGITIPIAG